MVEALAPAYIAHSLPGRLRLKIPSKRGDKGYFSEVSAQLQQRSEVAEVTANVLTGALLVRLAPGATEADLAVGGRLLTLFDLRMNAERVTAAKRSALVTATAGFKGVDHWVLQATGGYLDLKSSVFLVLLAMAARQIVRGHFMVPGFTLLWHALNMMME